MNKILDKKYDHNKVEKNKYDFWLNNNLFSSDPNSKKEKFSIIIPPPNVTGKLHIGHAWDTTLQDIIIRYKKLLNYEVLFLPGMDHSGISTQIKVEEKLKNDNIDLKKLTRDELLEYAWNWKDEYSNIIKDQWKKLGLSLNYDLETFTLDEKISDKVKEIFVNLYNRGLIYKGKRIVNWDVKQQTAISNIEVIFKESESYMYYFKYVLKDSPNEYLTVATTRPETMFADQCLVVNPNDDRYKKYIGAVIINPVNNKEINIISDSYVDQNFGTGVMKCTPAHDFNDYEIGIKHNLEMPICINEDGTINELGGEKYCNLDRFIAREKIINNCILDNTFVKKEIIKNSVGYSERSNTIVEPYLSNQWFVKMDYFANKILELQKSDNAINFFPKRFNDVLVKWMENIHDWTISRQLWWGHRIPAWYNKNDKTKIYVGINPPENIDDWIQDNDVLDTWFSSGLWAFAPLMAHSDNDNDYFKNFFPIDVLVTGYDIIFFWVARMIFQTLDYTGKVPFENVLIHGLVRDKEGKKMSKSLGNGIDPNDVIKEHGVDTLRFFLLTNSSPGHDIKYSEEKILNSWNFINKLWNASNFVLLNIDDNFVFDDKFYLNSQDLSDQDKWILKELSSAINFVYDKLDKYEFSMIGNYMYNFIWNKFCSWYIEFAKISLNTNKNKNVTLNTLYFVLKNILILIHPFIPFVTEEIYEKLKLKKSIMQEQITKININFDIKYIDILTSIISKIRDFRQKNNIANKIVLEITLENLNNEMLDKYDNIELILKKLVNVDLIKINNFNSKITLPIENETCFIEINNNFIDYNSQILELENNLDNLNKEILRSKNILNNENFLNKAKKEKINDEKLKYNNYLKQHEIILEKINLLKRK